MFLAILTSGIQHIIAQYNRKRDLKRIERFVRLGRAAAYGPKGVPIEGKRKVRVPIIDGGEDSGNARAGRMVDLLVDGTEVFMVSLLITLWYEALSIANFLFLFFPISS